MILSEKELLLDRECALAASSIGQGLTLLRKHNFTNHGYGTQAFFQLSIGIERLIKIILIYDFRQQNNNNYPTNDYLRKFSHNISELYSHTMKIADSYNLQGLYAELSNDNLHQQIIELLSDFAIKTRYFNLDTITGKKSESQEPLKLWNTTINHEIIKRHYKTNSVNEKFDELVDNLYSENVFVLHHNDDGKPILNYNDLINEKKFLEVKQKYSMYYVYNVVRYLSCLLQTIDKGLMPVASEYFQIFRITDKKYILSLKTWDIYKY